MNAESEMAGADGLGGEPKGAPCPVEGCDGTIEATGKVYFDVTALSADGEDVADMEFSGLNDTYDGQPCALEGELRFYCSNDHDLDHLGVTGRAEERSGLHGLSV